MTRQPRTVEEWDGERARLIGHIRALLLFPLDPYSRRQALTHLTEIFEDETLENVTP
jgi:hypothetical protein